jgi:uncharacterized protein YbgA (DUF1722 family)/uncharacterized protein YbbK (DUF523 family)
MEKKPLIGISKCLLGENVRYNGEIKLDYYLRDTLGKYVNYIPVCPEVELGMSTPREAITLVENEKQIRLITEKTNKDITEKMNSWIQKRLEDLSNKKLCGFIFKSKSPSCGLNDAEVRRKNGITKDGTGLFAKAFLKLFSHIPVTDEKKLNIPQIKENFIEQIFLVNRWKTMKEKTKSIKNLTDFHKSHKYLIMKHSSEGLKKLGRLLAKQKEYSVTELYDRYLDLLIKYIQKPTTIKKNTNVLMHLMGYFKKDLTYQEKDELKYLIEQYLFEHIPLIVPITIINHYVKKHKKTYLENQVFLNPGHPELMLRNHV